MAELSAGLEDATGGRGRLFLIAGGARGRLFLIAGEPGIGKTWLAEHLAGLATERGIRAPAARARREPARRGNQ